MKNNKLTVNIGIPAYNEEANIGYLLSSLLKQNLSTVKVKKIVVVSDGSSDRTGAIVKTYKSQGVTLLVNAKRSGQAFSQNRIIKGCRSDALILLNADIALVGHDFISSLALPIFQGQADLTSSKIGAVEPENNIEKTINIGLMIRNYMFGKYNNGQSVHTCFGAARAFSKRFYQRFQFKGSVSEDAYSYFSCKKLGYKYKHVPNAVALIKLPDNLKDHERQSMRNVQGKELLINEFGRTIVNEEYKGISFFFNMPLSLIVPAIGRFIILSPVYTSAYLGVQLWIKLKSLLAKQISDTWEISKSSKMLIKPKI